MATKKKTTEEAGVDEFIKRLRKKGIDEGKYRANEIVKEAEEKAKKIVAKAEKDAAKMTATAKTKSDKLEKSAKDAIKIAFRDSVLELQNSLQKGFIKELRKAVTKEVADKKLIKEMILTAIKNATSKDETEILIADPIKHGDTVKAATYGLTKSMLKGGVELKNFASHDKKGIVIKETKKGSEIDMTDKALSDLLLEHLLPAYKELISGEK